MNRYLQILTTFIFSSFFVTSCTKSTDKFVPYSNVELNDISWSGNGMTDAKAKQMKSLLLKPQFTSNFNTTNGVVENVGSDIQIALTGNVYLLNGSAYNGNTVNYSVKKISKKGDFIRNLFSSTSTVKIQEIKSAVLVNFMDDSNNNLSLSQNGYYTVRVIDSALNQDAKCFVGHINSVNEGGINWSLADSATGSYMQFTSVQMQGSIRPAYEISSKQISWLSIAKPLNFNSYVNSSIILPQNFTNKTTMVFAVFSDYNVVLQLLPDYASKTFLMKDVPLGIGVKLVSVSYIDDQFYLGKQDITVSKSPQYSINPALIPISISDLNAFLDGL